MGRNWGAAMQPTGLARPRGDSQTQLTVLLKTIGLDTSAAKVYLTLAGGVYSFFINVSDHLSIVGPWSSHLAGHTPWLPLSYTSFHQPPASSSAPRTAPWLSVPLTREVK